MLNYPNTIHLGDVTKINAKDLPKIDLLMGGSPCQSFSFAGKRKGMSTKCETEILTLEQYLTLKSEGFEFEGQSYLFWEYMRILHEVKPKYFLLENVEMGEKWEKILSKAIGYNGIHINSALVSAQNRKRIYWTNIGHEPGGLFGYPVNMIRQPKDKGILLKDILETEVEEKYYISDKRIEYFTRKIDKGFLKQIESDKDGKSKCLLATMYKQMQGFCISDNPIVHNTMPRSSKTGKGGTGPLSRNDGKTYCLDTGQTNAVEIKAIMLGRLKEWGAPENDGGKSYTLCKEQPHGIKENSRIRRLTPLECERLQTVPENYTNHVSDSQRYKMLGNGWTIDVIAHILSYLTIQKLK